jgi:hypothetical protein
MTIEELVRQTRAMSGSQLMANTQYHTLSEAQAVEMAKRWLVSCVETAKWEADDDLDSFLRHLANEFGLEPKEGSKG